MRSRDSAACRATAGEVPRCLCSLDPYPEVGAVLDEAPPLGYRTGILSNGTERCCGGRARPASRLCSTPAVGRDSVSTRPTRAPTGWSDRHGSPAGRSHLRLLESLGRRRGHRLRLRGGLGQPARPAGRISGARAGHVIARSANSRFSVTRQRAHHPRPAPGALVERGEVVFLVGRMDPVVIEAEADQERIDAERPLEIADDRDRAAASRASTAPCPIPAAAPAGPGSARKSKGSCRAGERHVLDEFDGAVGGQALAHEGVERVRSWPDPARRRGGTRPWRAWPGITVFAPSPV